MELKKRQITVLAGDKRSLALAEMFLADGMDLTLYGFDDNRLAEGLSQAKTLDEAIAASPIIIGPLPFTNRAGNLSTPLFTGEIVLEDVFQRMKEGQVLLGGHLLENVSQLASEYQIELKDYFAREELQVLNAIPTAEGTIQIAMEKMDTTLHGSNVMVLGFGRIGKTLANMLAGIGANVHVVARKHEDIAWIQSLKMAPVYLSNIEENLSEMDLIINTVPVILLDEVKLREIKEDCLIIDVASSPGGVDFPAAENLGITTVWALGLPGLVAPKSAAQCMKETIYHLLDELEV